MCSLYKFFVQETHPSQTGRQVVTSERKLNLRRDSRWVAKRTRKFTRKYTQVELLNCSIIKIIYKVCKGRINEEIAYRRLNIQLQYVFTSLVVIISGSNFKSLVFISRKCVSSQFKSVVLVIILYSYCKLVLKNSLGRIN